MSVITPSKRRRRIRALLWERQAGMCALCGGQMFEQVNPLGPHYATIDHIVPRAARGSDAIANLRLAHRECNEERGCAA